MKGDNPVKKASQTDREMDWDELILANTLRKSNLILRLYFGNLRKLLSALELR